MSTKLDAITRLMACWERRDVEGFLAFLTDDIEYYWHLGTRPVVGKNTMRKFLRNYDGAYNQTGFHIHNHAENGELLFIEGLEELYDRKHERSIRNPFMQAYEFRDGLIAKMRDYYEPANLRPPAAAPAPERHGAA
ncbi:nuclear transport factor 2 family protein [Kineobactrum salinum]|uniref:Nuclear transport factor 2 family protein n=1 Tax=Kineobactrum salinum TaxID=2708301 RepID=A0A6C0U4F9_9GAMM|nr:nuclear transport factor 2 family protein [Kineobactrum salinum]QIB65275.1 nuclear transport factor 2 family protein [Kineobactrum salinum]